MSLYPLSDAVWMMRLRCHECKEASIFTNPEILKGLRRVSEANADPYNRLVCQECGGRHFDDPRMGRRMPFHLLKPKTWFLPPWEWRDDIVAVIPTEHEKPNLKLLPFEKKT